MNKTMLVAAVSLTSMCTCAYAQSSVTLYGIVDAGVLYTSNVKGVSSWQESSGNESGSRWGMFGAEDLGGGTKAIFRLENGFSINNGALGQGGREFGRQAYVGLNDSRYGTVTFGRQYNPLQDYVEPLGAAGWSLAYFATHPYDNDNFNNTARIDNSIKYTSPTVSGFQLEAIYGFSNSTNFANNRAYSLGGTYVRGALTLGAAYVRMQAPGTIGGAVVGNPAAASTSNPFLSASRIDQWGVAGAYALGSATVTLLYTGSLYSDSATGLTAANGSIHFHNAEAGLQYHISPALIVSGDETYTRVQQAGSAGHYLQSNLGLEYFLSKRTDVYANVYYQRTSHNLRAFINGTTASSSSESQTAALVGIRHKF